MRTKKKGKKANYPRLNFVGIHAWALVSPGLLVVEKFKLFLNAFFADFIEHLLLNVQQVRFLSFIEKIDSILELS
jgi:hypothetical protein